MSNPTVSPLMQTQQAQALEWFLVVETGSLAHRRFPLTGLAGPLTMGRETDCAIRFDPNQERMVGRHHAHIEMRPDGLYLVDDQSANGTFKNGEAVSEVRLQNGDRFQLGGEVEGAQGPWFSIHMPIAVHLAPPRSEPATVLLRPGAPQAASAQAVHAEAPPPSSMAATLPPVQPSPQPVISLVSPPMPPPLPPAVRQPYSEGSAPFSRALAREPAAAEVDVQLRQRRTQLFRQLAVILLLLFSACAIGVALGLRPGAERDQDGAGQSE